jgi:hypothetical protein
VLDYYFYFLRGTYILLILLCRIRNTFDWIAKGRNVSTGGWGGGGAHHVAPELVVQEVCGHVRRQQVEQDPSEIIYRKKYPDDEGRYCSRQCLESAFRIHLLKCIQVQTFG